METDRFLVWVLFFGTIATVSIVAMFRAYVGKGSLAVVFTEPLTVPLLPTLNAKAAAQFQQGCDALRLGNYRKASDRLNKAIQQDPQFAEAYHNRGRAVANLRQDNEAAALLVKAGELYLEQENTAGYEQVKQDLQRLKQDRSQ